MNPQSSDQRRRDKAAEEKQTRDFWSKKIADLLAQPEELQEKPHERS